MSKMFWNKSRIAIVFHEATSGLGYDLRDYLLKQGVEELLFISHPLLYLKDSFKKSSKYELYKKGRLVKSAKAFHWILPEYLLYLKDVIYTILWCSILNGKYDLYFGVGNLNAFSGCILRFINKTNKVIYYVVDYVPQRFKNKIVDEIYHRIERFCAENCTWTWNLSPRMIEGRDEKWKMTFPHQLVVPYGVSFDRIKRLPIEKVNKTEILFMGTILEKQGIQLVIEVLLIIYKKIPSVKLTIIGKGPYEDELRKLIHKLGLEKYVVFLGYIPDHNEVENRIAKAGIGIALYDKRYDNFSYYADPGKIKNYLGAGIPVIMTDVPYIARQIEKAECGFIIPYNKNKLADLLLHFFSDPNLMKTYRKNAVKFAKKYDWNRVFDNAFLASLKSSE